MANAFQHCNYVTCLHKISMANTTTAKCRRDMHGDHAATMFFNLSVCHVQAGSTMAAMLVVISGDSQGHSNYHQQQTQCLHHARYTRHCRPAI